MATRPPKSPDTQAGPSATITPDALKAMLDSMNEMRAMVDKYKGEAEAAQKAMSEKPATMTLAGKTTKQVQNEIQVLRAFKKAGFKDAQPRINIMTFNRWIAAGRRPTEGSKSIKAGGMRLFHVSQTRELTAEEKAQPKAEKPSKGKSAKVIPIGTGAQQ